jgi:hypothetical protein
VEPELAELHAAAIEFLDAAGNAESVWAVPVAPGKWSPSQQVEHLARTLDGAANVVDGTPSPFPNLPVVVRPLLRIFFFNRTVKRGAFPRSRTFKALNPTEGPPNSAAAKARLDAAVQRFEQACRGRASSGETIATSTFGTIPIASYARFQAIHIRHHRKQLPVAVRV